MQRLNRRNFLMGSLGGVGALVALGFFGRKIWPGSTSASRRRFLVVLGIPHGADCTLGLDPQIHGTRLDEKDVFLEYTPEQILKNGDLAFGPAAAPLLPHARDIAVIHGVHCFEDMGHERSDVVSGMYPGKHGNMAAQFSDRQSRTPYGVLTNASFSLGGNSGLVTDLPGLTQRFIRAGDSLALPGLESVLGSEFAAMIAKINQTDPASAELYRNLSKQTSAHPDFCLLATCFASELATSAAIGLDAYIRAPNMDSHHEHPGTHVVAQRENWRLVADLFALFKSVPYDDGNLFDHTTFVACSEFSRTPYLNPNRGKDHNLMTNSILVAGAGLRSGRNIGKSHVWSRKESMDGFARHVGLPMNFTTGETTTSAREGFDLLTSESVARSVLEIARIEKIPGELQSYPSIRRLLES